MPIAMADGLRSVARAPSLGGGGVGQRRLGERVAPGEIEVADANLKST